MFENPQQQQVRQIVVEYQLALVKMRTLIAAHQALGIEFASPDLKAVARDVADLNARALEFVDRP